MIARMTRERVDRGGHEAREVEARVRPEVLVLDGGRRIEDLCWDLVEGDDLALELAEARQLDLAGPVGDERLLVERQIAQRVARVGQALAVVVVRGGNANHPRQADEDEDQEKNDRDRDGDSLDGRGAAGPPAVEAAPMALPPREAGLHVGPHDSIGAVVAPPVRTVETARSAVL